MHLPIEKKVKFYFLMKLLHAIHFWTQLSVQLCTASTVLLCWLHLGTLACLGVLSVYETLSS